MEPAADRPSGIAGPQQDGPLRVLVVCNGDEQRPNVRELLATRAGAQLAVEWRARYADALDAIRECRHDVYLIESRLGVRSGLDLVRDGFAGRRSAPVILLGGAEDELALDGLGLGVIDQLPLEQLALPALERAIRSVHRHHRAITRLLRSEERYSLAVRAANDGIWDWDLVTNTLDLSPRWSAILGRANAEPGLALPPSAWFDLVHPGDLQRLRGAIRLHLEDRTPHLLVEHRMRHADGSWRWVVVRGLAIRGADGAPARMAGSLSDVTDRRLAQQRLAHDALHDLLTGLPNRTLFGDRVNQSLARSRRDPRAGCGVMFFDVDRFKPINDSLGRAVGDSLLVALAARIASALRPGDTVARLGGDEFAVLLEELSDTSDASLIAERILRSLDAPFELGARQLFASVSIGIAIGAPGQEADELISNADIAMYDAKRRGRARSALFHEGMRRRVVDRLAREHELRQVVEGSMLTIHYQPIVDLQDGRISGLEALARWPDELGAVSPTEFISIAEETGIIAALGQQVLRAALAALASWRRAGLVSEQVCMSVNLSGRQLDDPALADQVRAAIERAELPRDALKLEITESTLVSEFERAPHVFADVCEGGIGLHLDDFGTGYSSLAALHRFPVDAIKIDRSFVAGLALGTTEASDVIVRSTVAMAHSLGLPVIAEGVETVAELRRLRALGCEFGQGHLFSPALSADEITELLRGWQPAEIVALAADS
ncbi:MAG: putative bifunctional diguanylate cyclase/phosphodiesterase [Solirubrobacteraceae bacterium]